MVDAIPFGSRESSNQNIESSCQIHLLPNDFNDR